MAEMESNRHYEPAERCRFVANGLITENKDAFEYHIYEKTVSRTT